MLPHRLVSSSSRHLRRIQSFSVNPRRSWGPRKMSTGNPAAGDLHPSDSQSGTDSRRPKKLIFAPGDIAATPDLKITATETKDPSSPTADEPQTLAERLRSDVSTPDSTMESQIVSHAARAHQFVRNPPLTISQMHPSNPLHQFNTWFRDHRLAPSSAPETCTLATASLPSGRVSARVVYLKELDERGWVVYSNWGSREGKGGQVFGAEAETGDFPAAIPRPGEEESLQEAAQGGNRWAALTFSWSGLERQVRIEGMLEPLSRQESEMYWETRERGSKIGAWASWQSKVLWSAEPETLVDRRRNSVAAAAAAQGQAATTGAAGCTEIPADIDETDIDDGRALLEQRVQQMEKRFAGMEKIPLPPFWGGVRLVPESVEFWQGRRSRLHDRFRYVRVKEAGDESSFKWRIERLSP